MPTKRKPRKVSVKVKSLIQEGFRAHYEGRYGDAIQIYKSALRRKQGDPEVLNHLGVAYLMNGNLELGKKALEKTVKKRPHWPEALANLGNLLWEEKRLIAAEACFAKAFENDPSPKAPLVFSSSLLKAGRAELAKDVLRSAIAKSPDARYYSQLSRVLAELSESEASLEAAQQAVALSPRSADALGNLAARLADHGRVEEAKDSHSKCLKLEPSNGWFHNQLALLTKYSEVTLHVRGMENALKRTNTPIGDKAGICFALAKAYDDIGDIERAFAFLKQGNDLYRQQQPFNLGEYETACNRMIKLFDAAFMEKHADKGDLSDQPVFIVGLPRSGTTLVEQILLSLEGVDSIGEVADLRFSLWHTFEACNGQSTFTDDIGKFDGEAWCFLAKDYLKSTNRATQKRVINKALENTLYMGVIATAFPNAKIIYCRRNIMDTCLSIYQRMFSEGAVPYGYNLKELAVFCRLQEKLFKHWKSVMADRFIHIHYEDLVGDPETHARRVVEYCDLPWVPACLDFYKSRRAVKTASQLQVRQAIYGTSVSRWKKYEPYLAPLMKELGDLVPF